MAHGARGAGGAPRVAVGAVTAEALRYAGGRFETALRACWLPVLILLAWQGFAEAPVGTFGFDALYGAGLDEEGLRTLATVLALALALVPLALTASYMAPLVLDAAGRRAVSHRTVPNGLGRAEAAWMAGSVLSLGGLFLMARAPVMAGLAGLRRLSEHAWAAEVATFEEGSLHASEVVPAYPEGVRDWLAGGSLELPVIGPVPIPTGAPGLVQAAGLLLLLYVWLRLFPLAAVMTAGSGGRGVLRATLDASAGWNALRLLGIVVLTGAANLALLWILGWVPVLFGGGLGAAYPYLAGLSAFGADGFVQPWVVDVLTLLSQAFEVVFTVLITALGAAVNAGTLGAIVRRVAPA